MLASNETASDEGLDIAVGRDAAGHWVAAEAHGLAGGIFTSRQDALRFAAALLITHRGRIEIGPAPVIAFGAPKGPTRR